MNSSSLSFTKFNDYLSAIQNIFSIAPSIGTTTKSPHPSPHHPSKWYYPAANRDRSFPHLNFDVYPAIPNNVLIARPPSFRPGVRNKLPWRFSLISTNFIIISSLTNRQLRAFGGGFSLKTFFFIFNFLNSSRECFPSFCPAWRDVNKYYWSVLGIRARCCFLLFLFMCD